MPIPSDLEISRRTPLKPIAEIGAQLSIPAEAIAPYGKYKAKIPHGLIDEARVRQGKLVLVTAMTPTPQGIGKTTTSIGLALGLNAIAKSAIVALREPSLGPCFGSKGGAAGGGYAQVLPMEEINLHFTGDFHAVTAANNLLAALVDNYQYQHRRTGKMLAQILWKRVLDVNDRSLRQVVTGLGGTGNGIPTEAGFEITPASEIMAILCLAADLDDLRSRIDRILLGYTHSGEPFTVRDLGVGGAIVALLKDAIDPNLVQTTENTPAIVHGGPFANIAHGCNSVVATKLAMTYSDYTVTEAGFGGDLGAEKFLNIKCRTSGLVPNAAVVVATSQALKFHGGVPLQATSDANLEGLNAGLANLDKHLDNLKGFGIPTVVCFNRFSFDRDAEIDYLRNYYRERGSWFAVNEGFARGGAGAIELAEAVVKTVEQNAAPELHLTYTDDDALEIKLEKVARAIYGAKGLRWSANARTALTRIRNLGGDRLPVCIAKTQYSFSDNPKAIGVATDFELNLEDLALSAGAGFVVAIAGNILRMPGLPKVPQANKIDLVDGEMFGLS